MPPPIHSASRPKCPGGPATPGRAAPDPAESIDFRDAAEHRLLAAHRRGEGGALEELLLSIEPRLVSLCFRMSGDPQRARDLCQDALVKIIQGLPGFSGRSRLSTWMIRIAMNVCLTDRRRQKLRRKASLDAPAKSGGEGPGGADRLEDAGEPTPGSRVERGEDLKRLAEGLARIDPEQRALLILRDAQGLEYADISEVLGVPVGTVKSRLFRARVALRQEIEKR
jgi:RNA polymerase sigma-70 factor (ECF subfamily)